MSDVASRELCEELFRVSRWWPGPDSRALFTADDDGGLYKNLTGYEYSMGYLLRKLPEQTSVYRYGDTWVASRENTNLGEPAIVEADTPENALCRLAIELFKQGLLPQPEPEKRP